MHPKAASINTVEGQTAPSERTFSVGGHLLTAPKAVPGLHLVATPIGNLGDITLRALETLAGVDIIACEDTRITRRLTERYAISARLKPYHEHNAATARPKILDRLAQGAAVALVSDAGTPLISDPGFKLVREAQAAGHMVNAVPGASAGTGAVGGAAAPPPSGAPPGPGRGSRAPACRPTGSSSKVSCRRGSRRGGRGWPSFPTYRRRWCCSRP